MSEVYRARDELLGREVAVKVLSERLAGDRSFVERFRREAQAAANLNHPNIVSLFDYGSDGASYYIVMEFIEGRSLAEIINADAPLLPERAAEIASDVASALERAHAAGIVHRDIKPANIMITSTGRTKVTDFGIARAIGGTAEQTVTQTGMVIGTAAYLSPEQAQGDPVDARSDVYSLGVVLYEALTGRPPFSGDTPLSIAYKHVRESPQPVSSNNPDVPAALESIVMKSLAKNPENRYAHAGEMHGDLERFRSGQKVLAPPSMADETMVAGAPTRAGTQVITPTEMYEEEEERERRPGLVIAGVLLLLLLAGLLAWLLAGSLFAEKVEVPRLVGLTEDEARAELDEAGLEVEVERRPHLRREEGEVFRQDPEAGDEVKEGDTVTIFVSQGPREVEVPDVTNENIEDAREILRDVGLRTGEVTREPHDEIEEDNVIRQSFPPGSEIPARTKVDLVVSSGPETIVPNVIGFTEEAAVQAIEAEGLVAKVNRAPDDAPEGTVIDQDPDGGTEAEPGDEVTILVSEGPEEREMPDVTGQDADEAEERLENDFGLDVSQQEETQACAEPPGRVCRQSPSPGTPVTEGDKATLFVQSGNAGLSPRSFWASLLFFFLA
jgi:beta-lactam-binding protein with PASTA domain